MNPGAMRHRATFYRRSGAATKDAHGRVTKAWVATASDVPLGFEVRSGRVVPTGTGQNVELAGKALVRRTEFAAGSEPRHGDAVVFGEGRTPATTYLVHRAGPWKDDYHYEELTLLDTEEAVP